MKEKSSFMIYAVLKILIHDLCSFESILVSEDNGKQNPEESHITKYQTHVACHYGNN